MLKLSEAIRIGAKMRPKQCFSRYFWGDDGACAVGAALAANDRCEVNGPAWDRLGISMSLHDQITDMNDKMHLTREEIADQLEKWGY